MVALYWDGLGGYLKCCSIQRKPPLLSAALPQGWANRSEEHDKLSAPSQLYTDSSLEIQDRSVTLKMSANTDQAWWKGCISRLGGAQGKVKLQQTWSSAGSFLPPLSPPQKAFLQIPRHSGHHCGSQMWSSPSPERPDQSNKVCLRQNKYGSYQRQFLSPACLRGRSWKLWKLPAGTRFSPQLLLQHSRKFIGKWTLRKTLSSLREEDLLSSGAFHTLAEGVQTRTAF